MTAPLWQDLAVRELLPGEQYADGGYVDAVGLVATAEQGIELIGPVQEDSSWQARTGQGYAAADFAVDWEEQYVTCPAGKTSRTWARTADGHGGEVIRTRQSHRNRLLAPAA